MRNRTEPPVRIRAEQATSAVFALAESPYWDPVQQLVYWVDIHAGAVHSGGLELDGTITVDRTLKFDGAVSAVSSSESGSLVVALDNRLVRVESDGDVLQGPKVFAPSPGRRLNDGKADPAGTFVVGTLTEGLATGSETLCIVDGDRIFAVDDDLTLSNGLGWSADGKTFYNVDTYARVVYRRPWIPGLGRCGARSVFLSIDDGLPDGLAVDENDGVWIAIWGTGEVRHYDKEGRLKTIVETAAPNVTSVAFCGPALSTLVITSSTNGLDDRKLSLHPASGALFTVSTGVAGAPQAPWSGRW